MRIFLRKLIPGVLLAGVLCGPVFAQSRVATVDMEKVFDKYWKTEQAVNGLKARLAEIDKSRKEMVDGLEKARDEYQKLLEGANNQAISTEERGKRTKAAENKLKDLKIGKDELDQFDRQANVTISEQKARMRKNILEEIKLAISSKAKAGGYAIVVDSGAQTYVADPTGPYYSPTVLYTADDVDISDAVISQLNAGSPVDLPKTQ
jgi:Skp family chaperone for outer membrane proteins